MPAFSQANKFAALYAEGGDDHEEIEVEEEPVETAESTPASTPMSKSAKKRAARAAAKAAADPPSQPQSNGKGTRGPELSAPSAAAVEAVQAVEEVISPVEEKLSETKSKAKAKSDQAAERASSPPPGSGHVPSSEFKPTLPSSLPQRAPQDLVRKRKADKDFTPSGPNDLAPTSPNKNSVKFEDGIVPGQGKDGEKTIAKPPVVAKHQNAIERTVWTFIMIFGFITLLCMGPPYVILLVLICQSIVYKEISALFDLRDHGGAVKGADGVKSDQWSKTLNWYFFVTCNYFLYGESIIYYFKHVVFVDAYFVPFAKNHRFISFMLYVLGFVGFVANLQRQYLRQQFALFCWVHITLLLVVVSSHFIVNNILEGLIWFFVPASLVICNDVFAYICGKMFGRTPLIKLSPKKTVEGFVGAFLCTLVFAYGWATIFQQFKYMVCPAKDLGVNVFSRVNCKLNPVFVWREAELPAAIAGITKTLIGRSTISYTTFQLHAFVMATFASLVAPFGGFFASGFKRAFNIKDFGHSIPGHGGMTDRMDCQFMMGLFAYVYYSSLIRTSEVTVGSILQTAVIGLTTDEQLQLLRDLKRYLEGQGVKAF